MSRGRLRAGLVALLVAAGGGAAQAEQVRSAILVGNNLGRDGARGLRFAEEEMGRLAAVLEGPGHFGRVDVLRGRSADEVRQALAAARVRMERERAAGRGTLFLFYYSGHGDHEALELGSTRLLLRHLREHLEALPADVRVGFVDACQSGAMTGVKGGRRAPAYEVRLADPGSVKGLAIVTSSTASELSQESDELRASFFSHSVMSGLRGAADSSGDGQVTLAELYQYAFRRTLSSTAASLVGGQHPTYDYRIAGTGDVILTRVRRGDARLVFPRGSDATYTVLRGDEVTAEVGASSDGDRYVALPAGTYRVLRRTLAGVTEARVALAAGSVTGVDPGAMVVVKGGDGQRKKDAAVVRANGLGLRYSFQSSGLRGTGRFTGAVGLALSRELDWASLRLHAALGAFDADDRGYRSSLWRFVPGADLLLPLWRRGPVRLLAGPTVAAPITRQKDVLERITRSYGFAYGLLAAADVAVGESTVVGLELDGGGELFRLNGSRVHRPAMTLTLGAGVRF